MARSRSSAPPPDPSAAADARMTLGAFIRARCEEIVAEWERVARAFPSARGLSRPALRDHVPQLLDRVAAALERGAGEGAHAEIGDVAAVHAVERLGEGYDLRQVAAEYRLLRNTVRRLWAPIAEPADALAEVAVLDETIDLAIVAAVDRYAHARERALAALDRIATAALGAPEDDFLPALTRVLKETVDSVDTAAVLLRDDAGALHVRAAVGVDDAANAAVARAGEALAGRVVATREPLELGEALGTPALAGEPLPADARAVYAVPMLHDDDVIGVGYIASRAAPSFSEEDKLLFRTMVGRATALIAQKQAEARLRESEERFRLLVDGVVDYAIVLLDVSGRVLTWNAGAERLEGYAADEIVGGHFSAFYAPEDVAQGHVEHVLEAARRDGRHEEEGFRVRKDGSRFWAHVLVTPLRAEDGALRGFATVTRDLSERVRAEHAVRDVEARAAAIVASALDCVISIDVDGKITEFNPAAERTFGVSRDEVLGKDMAEIVIPHVLRERHRTALARHLATGEARILGKRIEITALRRDGTEFPVELTVIRLAEGSRPSFTAFLRDITDRKRAELEARLLAESSAALAASLDYEETLRRVATLAIPAIADFCVVDLLESDGALRRVATAHVEAPMQEILQNAHRYAPQRDRPDLMLVRALETGQPQLATDVTDAWLARHVAISPEHLEHLRRLAIRSLLAVPLVARGQTLGVLTLVRSSPGKSHAVADVALALALASRAALAVDNARLFADQHRAREAASAAERRQHFLADASRRLAESIEIGTTVRTVAELFVPELADWIAIDVLSESGSIKRVAMMHKDPVRDRLAAEIARRYPPRAGAPRGPAHVVRTGEAELAVEVTDAMIDAAAYDPEHARSLRALGVRSYVCIPMRARGRTLGALTLVRDDASPPYDAGALGIAEDLAGRAALAMDNARLLAAAQAATRAREETLAIVSHDLRSPLGTVRMAADLLRSTEGDLRHVAAHAKRIGRAAEQMRRLIDDLLDLASIDAGRLAVERSPNEPASIVDEVFDVFRPLAEQKDLRMTKDARGPLSPVLCDRGRIVQALSNLLANAVKLTPAGGAIEVSAEARGREIVLAVRDTGPGIAESELPHLFDRYFRGRDAAYRGTGLGLAIAKGIVDAHGGRIWVESTVGEGSTFYIALAALAAS